MNMEDRLIWFKGKLVPANEALVPVLSPTAQFGLNVFEGIRGYIDSSRTTINLFRLSDHLDRLTQSCRLIGIDNNYSAEQIGAAIHSVISANKWFEDVALRCTLFVDEEGSWTSNGPVELFVAGIAKRRKSTDAHFGARACVSTWERIDDRVMPPRAKIGANYINGRYAHLEARATGFDFPILLDRNGKVTEGAGACLFMVRDGVLITPPVTASILESITRDTLIQLASTIDLPVIERAIDRTELYIADEVFLCGSAAEVTPLIQVDRFSIGNGLVGSVTLRIMEVYLATVGNLESSFSHWLSPVKVNN